MFETGRHNGQSGSGQVTILAIRLIKEKTDGWGFYILKNFASGWYDKQEAPRSLNHSPG